MRRSAHHAVGSFEQELGATRQQGRIDQGLVALHIDDDLVVGQAQDLAGLGQAVAAAGVVAACQHGAHAMRGAGLHHALVVACHDDRSGSGLGRLLGHANDHRFARQVRQRLVRQSRGCQARWNQHGESHRAGR